MTLFIHKLRDHLNKQAQYRQIVREIRSMPLDVALDVGIFREDAEELAARAVYGR